MTPSIQPVKRLPNMQDLSEKQIRARQHVAKKLLGNLSLRGYEQVETPILEQSELYIRKSGGGLSARLYDFNEPGGFDVSLRPEITAAVLRIAIEDRASSKTTRLMYEGPVFRYAAPDDLEGRSTRQFNQLGAELIGPNAPEADGEVIAASLEGLRDVCIDSAYVVIGHVGIILDTLEQIGVTERAKNFLVNAIPELKDGNVDDVRNRAIELGFISDAIVPDEQAEADRERLASTIEQVMTEGIGVSLAQNTGSRSPEEIIARLSRKLSQAENPDQFGAALEMLAKLATVNGTVPESMQQARKLLSDNGVESQLCDQLQAVIDSAITEGVDPDQITVDFGLARGVAYYTGVLFDIYASEGENTLGGGGRYDGLTRALGYMKDVPALGFAYNLDAVVELAEANSNPTEPVENVPLESDFSAAVAKTKSLRESGKRAAIEYPYGGVDRSEAINE